MQACGIRTLAGEGEIPVQTAQARDAQAGPQGLETLEVVGRGKDQALLAGAAADGQIDGLPQAIGPKTQAAAERGDAHALQHPLPFGIHRIAIGPQGQGQVAGGQGQGRPDGGIPQARRDIAAGNQQEGIGVAPGNAEIAGEAGRRTDAQFALAGKGGAPGTADDVRDIDGAGHPGEAAGKIPGAPGGAAIAEAKTQGRRAAGYPGHRQAPGAAQVHARQIHTRIQGNRTLPCRIRQFAEELVQLGLSGAARGNGEIQQPRQLGGHEFQAGSLIHRLQVDALASVEPLVSTEGPGP